MRDVVRKRPSDFPSIENVKERALKVGVPHWGSHVMPGTVLFYITLH